MRRLIRRCCLVFSAFCVGCASADQFSSGPKDGLSDAQRIQAYWSKDLSERLHALPTTTKQRLHLDLVNVTDSENAYRGADVATADVAAGHLNLFTGGMNPLTMSSTYLRERYDVLVIQAFGCGYVPGIEDFARAYNAVAEAEIRRRYGQDFFERIGGEAVGSASADAKPE